MLLKWGRELQKNIRNGVANTKRIETAALFHNTVGLLLVPVLETQLWVMGLYIAIKQNKTKPTNFFYRI